MWKLQPGSDCTKSSKQLLTKALDPTVTPRAVRKSKTMRYSQSFRSKSTGSFLKRVGPSDINLKGTPNTALQSLFSRTAFPADVSRKTNSQQYYEPSFLSIEIYLLPKTAFEISIFSDWRRSLGAVLRTAGPYRRGTFPPPIVERQWIHAAKKVWTFFTMVLKV